MDKQERLRLARSVEVKIALEAMMQTDGWKEFSDAMTRLKDRALESVTTDVEHHGKMARQAGRLDALLDVLKLPASLIREGQMALDRLNPRVTRSEDTDLED